MGIEYASQNEKNYAIVTLDTETFSIFTDIRDGSIKQLKEKLISNIDGMIILPLQGVEFFALARIIFPKASGNSHIINKFVHIMEDLMSDKFFMIDYYSVVPFEPDASSLSDAKHLLHNNKLEILSVEEIKQIMGASFLLAQYEDSSLSPSKVKDILIDGTTAEILMESLLQDDEDIYGVLNQVISENLKAFKEYEREELHSKKKELQDYQNRHDMKEKSIEENLDILDIMMQESSIEENLDILDIMMQESSIEEVEQKPLLNDEEQEKFDIFKRCMKSYGKRQIDLSYDIELRQPYVSMALKGKNHTLTSKIIRIIKNSSVEELRDYYLMVAAFKAL